jgi:hypothetical protein
LPAKTLAYSFDKDKICLKQVFEDLFANLFKKETSAELTFAGSQHWCDALLSTWHFFNLPFFQLAISQLAISQLAISPSSNFVNWPFHQLSISSTCHFIKL